MTEPDWKARAEAAEREVLLLKGELVSSKSREWPDGFKALEKERDAWKRCSEDLVNQRDEWKTGFNTERLLVASTEKLRVKAEAERDAAREALRELDQDLIGMGFRPKEGIRERVRRALEGA